MDRRLRCATVGFVGFFSVLAAGLPALSAAPEWSQLWDSAVARVSEGRFHEARGAVDRLVEAGGADERTTQMHTWLSAFDELQEQRRDLAQADYEKYVGWAKKRAESGKWDKAVNWLFAAFLSCEDREVFRQEPWVLEMVEQAMAHAETLREKGEWIEAIRIYGAFDEIFTPNGEVYHQLRKLCQLHILLEETYRADRQWKDDVRDIEPGMAHRALLLVSERYVTEPDFAQMTLSALERLVTLAATKKLAETFPSMESAELVEEFSRRIGYHIRRLRDEERVTLHRAVALFDRALEVNNDTLRIPQEVIIAEFMEGALEPLDEFSSMIWPAEFDAFRKETMGEFSGVGIQITLENRVLKVISPLEDTPAYEAGIQPGDVITKVDGETTVGISIDQAVRRITGPVLTNVVLTIRRAGVEEEFDVSIQRDRIKIRTVKGVSREVNGQWNCWADPDMKIAY
ncbi:MAG: PDZ domain-containing protein, partial [Phycisphaerae bacterium]|nr:PDZ domain-containing protein [Phycisphaerae bacterium]